MAAALARVEASRLQDLPMRMRKSIREALALGGHSSGILPASLGMLPGATDKDRGGASGFDSSSKGCHVPSWFILMSTVRRSQDTIADTTSPPADRRLPIHADEALDIEAL
eukprot:scaffold1247_cov251-Pinguiococcus_pyrenoidosus.AAC.7